MVTCVASSLVGAKHKILGRVGVTHDFPIKIAALFAYLFIGLLWNCCSCCRRLLMAGMRKASVLPIVVVVRDDGVRKRKWEGGGENGRRRAIERGERRQRWDRERREKRGKRVGETKERRDRKHTWACLCNSYYIPPCYNDRPCNRLNGCRVREVQSRERLQDRGGDLTKKNGGQKEG